MAASDLGSSGRGGAFGLSDLFLITVLAAALSPANRPSHHTLLAATVSVRVAATTTQPCCTHPVSKVDRKVSEVDVPRATGAFQVAVLPPVKGL